MAADAVTDVVRGWGRKLALDIPASRATSARLRRCTSIFEALLEPETIALIRAARAAAKEGARAPEDERLALLAIALAHRPRDGGSLSLTRWGEQGMDESLALTNVPDIRHCDSALCCVCCARTIGTVRRARFGELSRFSATRLLTWKGSSRMFFSSMTARSSVGPTTIGRRRRPQTRATLRSRPLLTPWNLSHSTLDDEIDRSEVRYDEVKIEV
jgi:hypothetical protein